MPSAYFFLSDIRGYTAYLTGTELDHAQDILNTLFEALFASIKPPLKIAKLEGDAIFAYLPAEQICHGQTILDTIESMYTGFRRVQKIMRLNTTCTCRACKGLDELDLKFFVHYGDYVVQRLMGQEELAGPAVILAHRLMKNTVSARTGMQAYAMFTDAAIQAMQARETATCFVCHAESYEHLGSVPVYLYDLHPYWEKAEQMQHEYVRPEAASAIAHIRVPAPTAVVWDIFTNPITRSRVVAGQVTASGLKNGRLGAGSSYHCAHPDGSSVEEIVLDWQPLEYITTRELAQHPGINLSFLMTAWIEEQPDGTSQVTLSLGTPRSEDPALQPMLDAAWPHEAQGMVQFIEKHAAEAYAEILAGRGL